MKETQKSFSLTQKQLDFIDKFKSIPIGASFKALKEKLGEPTHDMSPNYIYHTYVYPLPTDNGLHGTAELRVPYDSGIITGGRLFGQFGDHVVIDENIFKPKTQKDAEALLKLSVRGLAYSERVDFYSESF